MNLNESVGQSVCKVGIEYVELLGKNNVTWTTRTVMYSPGHTGQANQKHISLDFFYIPSSTEIMFIQSNISIILHFDIFRKGIS